MNEVWTQYTVECTDGKASDRVFDSLWQARKELQRIRQSIDDQNLSVNGVPIEAYLVEREVEAGDWVVSQL